MVRPQPSDAPLSVQAGPCQHQKRQGSRGKNVGRPRSAVGTRQRAVLKSGVAKAGLDSSAVELEINARRSGQGAAEATTCEPPRPVCKAQLEALILDAFQRHLDQHCAGTPPQDQADVQRVLREACAARLLDLECPDIAEQISLELLEGLRRYVAVLDGAAKRSPNVGAQNSLPAKARSASAGGLRSQQRQRREQQQASESRHAEASLALHGQLLELNNFMKEPDASSTPGSAERAGPGDPVASVAAAGEHVVGVAPWTWTASGALPRHPSSQSVSTFAPTSSEAPASSASQRDVLSDCASVASTLNQDRSNFRTSCGSRVLSSPEAARPLRIPLAQKAARRGVGAVSAADREMLLAEFAAFRGGALKVSCAR